MSRPKLGNRRVQLLLPPSLLALFDSVALSRGQDRSSAVAEAMRAWLLARAAEAPPQKRSRKSTAAAPIS